MGKGDQIEWLACEMRAEVKMGQVTYGHLLCHLQACGMELFLKQALETDHQKVLG